MPLPHASCADDIPADTCCNTFWLIGERIRTVATNAVCSCIEPDCADRELRSYQTEGEQIQDPLGESVIVAFVRSSVRIDGLNPNQSVQPTVITRAEFRVQLLETGWPTIQARQSTASIEAPDSAMIHALAKHARGHAEKMWRAVLNAASTTNQAAKLFPSSSNPHILTKGVGVGEMRPLPRPGPFIGYAFNVTVDTKL